MERTPVTSSHLREIGYDSENQILEVEFKNGSVYQYHGVPEYEHDAVMSAGSHGTYFNANIKNRYTCTKL
jgi:hypothetical protein